MNSAPPLGAAAISLTGARLRGFRIALAAALLLLVLPMAPFLVIPVAWPFLGEQLGVHRVHDIGVATMLWLMVAGLLVQVRRAEHQVGGMQQVLVVVLTMLGLTAVARPATLLSPLLLAFGLVFAAAALHPARAELGRVRLGLDPFLGMLALVAAGPLLTFAGAQLRLDHTALPIAAHGGHWTAMAALAVSILALAFLGASRPRGWRVPVWSVGGGSLLFGVSSAALPHMPSSIGPVWGALAAAWGVAFVVVAEVRYRDPPGRATLVS
jgi:hypothetical protein